MKLPGEIYWWRTDNQGDCRHWFVLQALRAWYAPKLQRPQFSDLVAECKEPLASVGKILENMTAKGANPEPLALSSLKLLLRWHHSNKRFPPGPQKLKSSVIRSLYIFPAKPILKLILPLAAMRTSFFLISPDVYDSLQIFLQETSS